MEKVGNVTPYSTNTVERLANADDMWFAYENVSPLPHGLSLVFVNQ